MGLGEKIKRKIEKNPMLCFLLIALGTFFPTLEALWALFYEKPMFPTIAKWIGGVKMSDYSLMWLLLITIPVGLCMMVIIIIIQFKRPKKEAIIQQEREKFVEMIESVAAEKGEIFNTHPNITSESTDKKPSGYPIEIEFENTSEFNYKDEHTDPLRQLPRSLDSGQWHHLCVGLKSKEKLTNVQAQLYSLKPQDDVNQEIKLRTPIPLRFTNESNMTTSIKLPKNGKTKVSVVSFFMSFFENEIVIEQSGVEKKPEIWIDKEKPYILEIWVDANELTEPIKRKFILMRKRIVESEIYSELHMKPKSQLEKEGNSSIKIKYKENHPDYYHEAWMTKHHIICIENTTNKTIEDASVELTYMEPRHEVFNNLIPMPLEKSILLNHVNNFFTLIQ